MTTITPVLKGIPLSNFKRNTKLFDSTEAAKRTILHGIPPRFAISRIEENGKEKLDYVYPIYSIESMWEARQMNRIAIMQAKHPIKYTYPNATKEDLIRLTSEDNEYATSRVTWTNPKDGNVYHILKERTTKNGNIIVKILDKDGAFIKEAEIKPKTILVIDEFDTDRVYELCPLIKNSPTHGEIVCKFIQKYNPFANIILEPERPIYFDDILIRRIKNGEKFDYVNFSQGVPDDLVSEASKLAETSNTYSETFRELDKLLEQNNIRVIISSGNKGKGWINPFLRMNNVEGCCSINSDGKISEFSSFGNTKYTQHLEHAEFKLEATEKGIKIVGPDIIFPYDICLDIIGKNIEDVRDKLKEKRRMLKYLGVRFRIDENRNLMPVFALDREELVGTSIAAPQRTAKLSLNATMRNIL